MIMSPPKAIERLFGCSDRARERGRRRCGTLLRWQLAAGFPLAATIVAFSSVNAQQGEVAMTCTNPFSGASWQIRIDYDKQTVDSNPAHVSDATISWRDAKDGGNYTLDRKSGNLTVIIASATGGNFLYDHCKLEN
jgi:hypothetical protein